MKNNYNWFGSYFPLQNTKLMVSSLDSKKNITRSNICCTFHLLPHTDLWCHLRLLASTRQFLGIFKQTNKRLTIKQKLQSINQTLWEEYVFWVTMEILIDFSNQDRIKCKSPSGVLGKSCCDKLCAGWFYHFLLCRRMLFRYWYERP